jgi:type I restriction enzyme S subunit
LNKSDLSGYITGSAQPKLNKANLNSIRMVLPPFEEQKAIANTLSTLDEKIDVNIQINKTLENMAQVIFKQWFVDFEFPNEEGEPYKSSGGEMFESELGMIPKGWEVKKSSDIANVNIGKTPPRKEKECFTLDPDDYKWISIKDLGNSGAYIFDSSEYLTKESIEKYNVKVVPDNTVVLSFKLTIGRVSITCGQMTTNEAIAHFNLSNKSKITTEYLYLYLKGFDYGKLGNTSSIANAVNSKIIKSMPIIVPDNKTIKTFSEVMESVFSKIKYTIKQSDKLIEIRDSLLPKLMSGEIRVPLDEEGIVS